MLENLLQEVKLILNAPEKVAELKLIYPPSLQIDRHNVYFIFTDQGERKLGVYEDVVSIKDFKALDILKDEDRVLISGDLNEENLNALEKRFPFIKPVSRHGYKYSFGLGDRLGLAGNAHLKLFKGRNIMPVLAQQSIRELLLTKRTFSNVLNDAKWSVFTEGYKDGWGADGDHVKTPYEVDYAVRAGFSMITLDCTEEIHNEVAELSDEQLNETFNALDETIKNYFNDTYLNKTFPLTAGGEVHFSQKELQQSVLIFFDAVLFAKDIYEKFVVPYHLDFEISMDETIVPTTPANHYFFAKELQRFGITPETLAPKFYGEFQKAIDYIGDINRFAKEYAVHEAIAEEFHYRLSIHSGSDKLSVYPIIGEISKNGWHVKTAGTNWLEALKVIALKDPSLMKEIYTFSYENLADVKSFYEFKATQETAPNPQDVSENKVFSLLLEDDPRQVLHTMYGSILNLKKNFSYVYRDRFFKVLRDNQDLYDELLNRHLAKHLDLLQGLAKDKEEVLEKYDYQK